MFSGAFGFTVFGPMVLALPLWEALFFWALVVILFGELCCDQGIAAFVTLMIGLAASYFLGWWTVAFVEEYHRQFLWMLAFYVPLGVIWATAKWWLHCIFLAGEIRDAIAAKQVELKNDPQAEKKLRDYRDRLPSYYEELPPKVRNHKADLTRWMAWWPLSIISSLFSDFFHRIFSALYRMFANLWQAIANATFRNVDWKNPEPQAEE